MTLYDTLRAARRSLAESDDDEAARLLATYVGRRAAGEVEPAVAGDVCALDLLRALSDTRRMSAFTTGIRFDVGSARVCSEDCADGHRDGCPALAAQEVSP